MNFISETQLEENKRLRGERVEDGTVTVDKPLYEILKEQKEKKEAEHKEKFKNRPPRALDEDELEFLEAVEQKKREDEKEKDDEDKRALSEFQAALLSRTVTVDSHATHATPDTATAQAAGAPGSSASSIVAAIRKRKEPDLPLMPRLGVKVQLKAKPKAKSGGAPDKAADSRATGASKADSSEGEATRQKGDGRQSGGVDEKGDGGSVVGLGLGAYGSDDDDDDN
ncbi:unnamed protein product [Closterium sp. Yama58-4]|nr:unnamed protein product [Closterium sp. Yama58-4]